MALTGHITVTPEQLKTQARVVRGEIKQMQGLFDSLKQMVTGMEGVWKGEASNAHRESYLKKISRIEEMYRRYQEHVRDLETIAGVYERTEAKAKSAAEALPASVLD